MTNDKPDKLEELARDAAQTIINYAGPAEDWPSVVFQSITEALRQAQQTSLPSYEEFSNAWEACQGRVCPLLSLYDYLVDNTKPKPHVSEKEIRGMGYANEDIHGEDGCDGYVAGFRAAEKHHGVGER